MSWAFMTCPEMSGNGVLIRMIADTTRTLQARILVATSRRAHIAFVAVAVGSTLPSTVECRFATATLQATATSTSVSAFVFSSSFNLNQAFPSRLWQSETWRAKAAMSAATGIVLGLSQNRRSL